MGDSLQTHQREPEFLFLVYEWRGFARDPSHYTETPTWIFTWMSTSKDGTRNGLPIAFLLESCKKPQASRQSDSILICHQKKKPQEPTQTSWPQEKGRWAITPDSRMSHQLHSHAFGSYSRSKYDFLREWFQEACHLARVRWEARCEGFCSKEGPHYRLEQKVRNQLERDQVQRAIEKSSSSCLLTSNNQPYLQGQKSVHNSSPGLYCVYLAEAYVAQENVSSRLSTRRKGMIHICSTDIHTRNLRTERRNGEGKPVLILVPGSHDRLTSRKHIMCARNRGHMYDIVSEVRKVK
jgi:hypothetical protein